MSAPRSKLETGARLAIEIADHHLRGAPAEKRLALARAILNAISICEREVADAILAVVPAFVASPQPSNPQEKA